MQTRVTVGTFNIHHGEGRDGRVDLGRTAAVLGRMGCDLVALQELDRGVARSGSVDQAAELATMVGMNVHFFPAISIGTGEYGLGLAAREEIRTTVEPLPRTGDEERRIAVIARWRGLSVIATHLSKRPASADVQFEFLATVASRLDPPVVLLGDLNRRRKHLRALEEAGFVAARVRPPWSWLPREVEGIDHILVKGEASLHGRRMHYTFASDHPGVTADVVVP